MTTAAAAMARGRAVTALKAHLFGAALVAAVAILGLAGLAEAGTGRNLLGGFRPRRWWLAAAVVFWLLGWGVKVVLGLLTGQYPLWR